MTSRPSIAWDCSHSRSAPSLGAFCGVPAGRRIAGTLTRFARSWDHCHRFVPVQYCHTVSSARGRVIHPSSTGIFRDGRSETPPTDYPLWNNHQDRASLRQQLPVLGVLVSQHAFRGALLPARLDYLRLSPDQDVCKCCPVLRIIVYHQRYRGIGTDVAHALQTVSLDPLRFEVQRGVYMLSVECVANGMTCGLPIESAVASRATRWTSMKALTAGSMSSSGNFATEFC